MKYPRTYHLPGSPGATSDDKILKDTSCFDRMQLMLSEKMDGENTCMMHDSIHARSENSKDHPSRHLIKQIHAQIKYKIPKNYAIYGENLFAEHSIPYRNLPYSGFLVFAVIDVYEKYFLNVIETNVIAAELGFKMVPQYAIKSLDEAYPRPPIYSDETEGYVIRSFEGFYTGEAHNHMAKWVRRSHVRTDQHWTKNWRPNHRVQNDLPSL